MEERLTWPFLPMNLQVLLGGILQKKQPLQEPSSAPTAKNRCAMCPRGKDRKTKSSARTARILALVPKSGAGSDIENSDSSEDEVYYARKIVENTIFEGSDVSSEPPSLGSSFVNLHLLSDSGEDTVFITTVSSSVIDSNINSCHQVPTPSYLGPDSPSILASVSVPTASDSQNQQIKHQSPLATNI
ncbi:unnamed protein product [Parnassius apollo]|uniref:(apollo) hypothetical protein n=1 Tax=Parnassius apollo TaxID=110799 RepID=A0A8S3W7M8_PARAO|nr:unnamed protein product [Parnassius apollo]